MNKYKFSVCTACFNSEKTLHRVYESLESQTFRDFEWIVINDASTDGTRELIGSYKKKASFDINFINMSENQMVTSCYNQMVKESRGEFLLHLDHDDSCEPNTLLRFDQVWSGIDPIQRRSLAGMMCNCKDQYGTLVGHSFHNAPCIDNFWDMTIRHKANGEKFFCYLVKVLLENNFPTVDRYVPESVPLYNISDEYDTYFFNESLRTYHVDQFDYVALSSLRSLDFPIGFRHASKEIINRRFIKLMANPKLLISVILSFTGLSSVCNIKLSSSIREIKYLIPQVIILSLYPLGVIKFKLMQRKLK